MVDQIKILVKSQDQWNQDETLVHNDDAWKQRKATQPFLISNYM